MVYGDLYSKIPDEVLKEISGIKSCFFIKLAKLYFKIFGYPDVAGNGRFPIVMDMLKPKKNEKILDAGCGNGIYANAIAYYFSSKVIGLDIDKKRIEIGQEIANSLKTEAQFFCQELEKTNFPKNTFDEIICLEVIEHIKNDRELIENFNSMLKKEGILILSTSKKESWTEAEEREYFKKEKRGEHVRSGYDYRELREMLKLAGFKILKTQPYYRFFTRIFVKAQQKIYKNNYFFLNILTYPLFSLIVKIDNLIDLGWYRGFTIKAVKNE